MAFSIASSVDRIDNVRAMDLPVGKWLLFGVGLGLASGVVAITKVAMKPTTGETGALPAIAGGVGLAVLAKKVPMVRNFMGDKFAEMLAVAGGVAALEDAKTLDLSYRVKDVIARIAIAVGAGKESKDDYYRDITGRLPKTAFKGVSHYGSAPFLGELPVVPMSLPSTAAAPLESIPAGRGYYNVQDRLSMIRMP